MTYTIVFAIIFLAWTFSIVFTAYLAVNYCNKTYAEFEKQFGLKLTAVNDSIINMASSYVIVTEDIESLKKADDVVDENVGLLRDDLKNLKDRLDDVESKMDMVAESNESEKKYQTTIDQIMNYNPLG